MCNSSFFVLPQFISFKFYIAFVGFWCNFSHSFRSLFLSFAFVCAKMLPNQSDEKCANEQKRIILRWVMAYWCEWCMVLIYPNEYGQNCFFLCDSKNNNNNNQRQQQHLTRNIFEKRIPIKQFAVSATRVFRQKCKNTLIVWRRLKNTCTSIGKYLFSHTSVDSRDEAKKKSTNFHWMC